MTFISYTSAVSQVLVAGNTTDTDIMLAKMDADSLVLGSAQQVLIGGTGTVGSMGGVYIDDDNKAGVSPDIAVGDDDVLHVTWFAPTELCGSVIRYKSVPAANWNDTGSLGLESRTQVLRSERLIR